MTTCTEFCVCCFLLSWAAYAVALTFQKLREFDEPDDGPDDDVDGDNFDPDDPADWWKQKSKREKS